MKEWLLTQFPVLENVYFDNALLNYLAAIGIFAGSLLVLYLLNAVVVRRLKSCIEKSAGKWDDFLFKLVKQMIIPLFYVAAFYFAMKQLVLAEPLDKAVKIVVLVAVVFQAVRLFLAIALNVLQVYWSKDATPGQASLVARTINAVVKAVVWGLALVFVLDNLGINISALVAGLGIGGIAVALAAQNILGDLFNYFVIFFDVPFEIGDFVILDQHLGVVEHVGIKTTRIRSLGGEQIIISNSDLTSSRIRNYKRMQKRRVLFKLGVTYQTTHEQLRKIPDIIRKVIEAIPETVFDRAHFQGYGDFSLDIEIVYYVLSSDYNKYMDIQQAINLGIFEAFEKEKIEFAYPTRTLYLHNA